MTDDVLKKPVHVALLRTTTLEQLAATQKIGVTPFGVDPTTERVHLPQAKKERPYHIDIPKAANYAKLAKKRVQLRVVHDRIPAVPVDKQPPCSSCKTAACCRVFVVNLTELEYESGVYGDSAVKLTPEIYQQLQSRFAQTVMLTAPRNTGETSYYLEGSIGQPCPFLLDDNRCGIYENRPRTCRVYTCVGDPRITEGMRQGTEPMDPISVLLRNKEVNAPQSPKQDS